MRSVSYVQRVALDFGGSLFPHAICLGDADNDTVRGGGVRGGPGRGVWGSPCPGVAGMGVRMGVVWGGGRRERGNARSSKGWKLEWWWLFVFNARH